MMEIRVDWFFFVCMFGYTIGIATVALALFGMLA
jgi:hypothetical protein